MGRLLLLLLLTSTSSHTDSLQSELNFLLASATLFLSHFMSLLSHLYRSEEQRKNHREQLLPPLVKKQKPPPTPSPKLTHIYIYTHTHRTHITHTHINMHTRSLLPFILSAVDFGLNHRKSGWGCHPLWLNTRPIWGFFLCQYSHFLPQNFYWIGRSCCCFTFYLAFHDV